MPKDCATLPLSKNEYTVKIFCFTSEIIHIKHRKTNMANFDVKYFFTNIPLNETIKIVVHYLFREETTVSNFDRPRLTRLLNFVVKDSSLIFNNNLYMQIDGADMGSSLRPTFANCFLCH